MQAYKFRRSAEIRSEEHTSELQSHSDLVCRLLLEKKKVASPINDISRGLCSLSFRTSSSLIPAASSFFFFNDPATTEIYTLSLHDALPISAGRRGAWPDRHAIRSVLASPPRDRKSTRLNSSHTVISYAVLCLKKKTIIESAVQKIGEQVGNGRAICAFYGGVDSLVAASFFFFNDTATTEIYTLSLHDALPISPVAGLRLGARAGSNRARAGAPG